MTACAGPGTKNRAGLGTARAASCRWRGRRERIKGRITIAKEKRIAWHRIRAEYIAGASQRILAAKYGVSASAVQKRCRAERWTDDRRAAKIKIAETVIQKTADSAADNAVTAQRIKARLLEQLETLVKDQLSATETRRYDDDGNLVEINRLRDLAGVLKDLTDDLPKAQAGDVEDLSPLLELLK